MDDKPTNFDEQLRTLQLIIIALAAGPAVFAGVVLLVIPGDPAGQVLTRVGLLIGLLVLAIHQPVGRRLRGQARHPDQRMPVYVTSTIVSAAILEGGTFFNLLAYMQERSNWSLAMAGLLWLATLMKFPTRSGVQAWLDRQDREAQDAAAFSERP